MSTIHECDATGQANTALAAKNGQDYWACRKTSQAGDLKPDLGQVGLTGTTAATNEVIGQYLHTEFDGVTSRIRTTGLLYLRAKAAYAAADNGKGVESSDTAGLVQPASAKGGGFGVIVGGGVVNIDGTDVNIYKVYAK